MARSNATAKGNPRNNRLDDHRAVRLNEAHPGCMLVGFLLVNRVPGNFHIEARSNFHNINPVMANLSHVVNQLSFGPILSKNDMK